MSRQSLELLCSLLNALATLPPDCQMRVFLGMLGSPKAEEGCQA